MPTDQTDPRPPLPVEDMLDALIGDSSSDYNDGDHPGYYRHTWDPDTGRLTMRYEHEDDVDDLDEEYRPTHAPTSVTFRLEVQP